MRADFGNTCKTSTSSFSLWKWCRHVLRGSFVAQYYSRSTVDLQLGKWASIRRVDLRRIAIFGDRNRRMEWRGKAWTLRPGRRSGTRAGRRRSRGDASLIELLIDWLARMVRRRLAQCTFVWKKWWNFDKFGEQMLKQKKTAFDRTSRNHAISANDE